MFSSARGRHIEGEAEEAGSAAGGEGAGGQSAAGTGGARRRAPGRNGGATEPADCPDVSPGSTSRRPCQHHGTGACSGEA